MIRITAYATSEIEDVSSVDAMKALQKAGIKAKGVRVARLTQKQYDKGMEKQ
jgi:hypothetical protein